jgi:hypothetical protein
MLTPSHRRGLDGLFQAHPYLTGAPGATQPGRPDPPGDARHAAGPYGLMKVD